MTTKSKRKYQMKKRDQNDYYVDPIKLKLDTKKPKNLHRIIEEEISNFLVGND